MKRVLLASTALCLGAGMATAQDMMSGVTVSGDGRMGVVFDDDENARFDSRVRIKFAASATLDNGLTAGGDVRAEQDGSKGAAGKVFLSGPFGTLAMGDVDPGAKAALGHPAAVGYTEVGSWNEVTYTRGGDPDPTLLYTLPPMGPVQAYASVSQEPVDGVDEVSFDTLSVGAKADLEFGDMGSAWLGAGFESSTDEQDGHLMVGAGATVSGFTGKIVAGTRDDDNQFGVSAGYSAGQIGATVFYTDAHDMGGAEAMGLGLSWSLGGGASIVGGVATNIGQGNDPDVRAADLGVTFSF